MAIKYKSHTDFDNTTIISFTKWDDSIFLMAIPKDEANTDYQEYLEWVSAGGVTEAAD